MSATPSRRNCWLVALGLLLAGVLLPCSPSAGQGVKGKRPDFIPADYDDYKHMLAKLGITKMRKGRQGGSARTPPVKRPPIASRTPCRTS